jgi:hypothetical protein
MGHQQIVARDAKDLRIWLLMVVQVGRRWAEVGGGQQLARSGRRWLVGG